MAWGRIDDRWWRHRKTKALDRALRGECALLYWSAISWSNDELADGVITLSTIRMLDSDETAAAELVRVAYWEAVAPGVWQIHDYADYNKLRAQILEERKAERLRQEQWRRDHPDSRKVSRRDQQRDHGRDLARDQQRDTQPVSLARPVTRSPSPVLPSPEDSPPPPAQRGRRADGSNMRAVGANPRAVGDAPRQQGTSTRQERDAQKRGPSRVGEILAEAMRRVDQPVPAGAAAVQLSIEELG